MTRLVQFYGAELFEPDTYSKTNVDGLAQATLEGVGRLALIGEAEGGEPKTIIKLTNSDLVKQLFRSGALADMGVLGFRGGVDEDVPNGASEVYFYNVSRRTQSALSLSSFDAKSKDYGLHTNKLNMTVIADATDTEQSLAKFVTVEFEGESITSESLGLLEHIRLSYVGAEATCTAQIDALREKLTIDVAGTGHEYLFSSYKTINDLVSAIEADLGADIIITQPDSKSSFACADLDHQTVALDIKTNPRGLRASAYEFMNWVNDYTLVDVERKAGATGATIPTAIVKTYFAGATKTATANSDFQDGFNAFRHVNVNAIVPLISKEITIGTTDSSSVFAQAKAFATSVNSIAGRNETQVFLGSKINKSEIKTEASSMNYRGIQYCPQYINDIDVDGNLVDHPAYGMAVVMASTRLGSSIGTSLTGKSLPVNEVKQDSTWNPTDDMKELLLTGYLIARHDPESNVPYCIKDITTVVDSDNNGHTNGEVVESLMQYAFQCRRYLTARLRGKDKGNPARPDLGGITERDVKEFIADFSDFAINNKLIIAYDEKTIGVRFEGDVLYPKIGVQPREGINFTLLEINAVRLV